MLRKTLVLQRVDFTRVMVGWNVNVVSVRFICLALSYQATSRWCLTLLGMNCRNQNRQKQILNFENSVVKYRLFEQKIDNFGEGFEGTKITLSAKT